MKIKQQLYITNPDEFMAGDYQACFNLFGDDDPRPCDGWVAAGEVWLDVEIDRGEMAAKLISDLDKAAEEVKADAARKLEQIAAKKQELLAIEYREAV